MTQTHPNQPQLIEHVCTDDQDIIMVQYQQGNWTLAYHTDPGLDYAVDPQGNKHYPYNPYGPYSHPAVPQVILDHVTGYFDSIYD
jgi:hypothetical protein